MHFEEEYVDVLQNIEFAITSVYQEHSDLTDYEVMRALESLIDAYSGEQIGRPPRDFRLSDHENLMVDRMRVMCEWRLGRGEAPGANAPEFHPEPISIDEVILCLKRILKSANKWNKEGGRRGYLDFIVQYVY